MEKIIIFGATGRTGLCAVEAAVHKDFSVRAFVRDSSRLPDHLRKQVDVVVGDVLNYEDVSNAVRGVTGVVVVLGTNNDLRATTVISTGIKNILNAMKTHQVRIISVCLSAFLFRPETEVPDRFRDLNADHKRGLEEVKQSGLNYIAVLPPHISKQACGDIIVEKDACNGRQISKHDLGRFLVDSLTQSQYYGTVVGIHSKPSAI